MNHILTPADFPLRVIGNLVYARTQSSPVIIAPNGDIADDLCGRLNSTNLYGFEAANEIGSLNIQTKQDRIADYWNFVNNCSSRFLSEHFSQTEASDKVCFGTQK